MTDPETTTQISEGQALKELRAKITYDFDRKDLAKHFDMSPSNMSAILAGNRPIPDTVLASLGYARKTHLVRIDDTDIENQIPEKSADK